MVCQEEALMKKKQLITLIIMLVVIAGLSVGYVLMKDYNDKKSKEESAEEDADSATIPVYDINTDDIVKISYTNADTSIDMVLDNGKWVQDGTGVPMNSENVDAMIKTVDSVDAIKVILEDAKNLNEYGLDKPAISYSITTSDGTKYNVKLGSSVSAGEGYYALLDSDTTVYDVSTNYFEPFQKTLTDMIEIQDKININADYITHVNVNNGKDPEFDAEYFGDENAQDDYYTWRITKPYTNVNADTDSLNQQLANYAAMSYNSCAAYGVADFSQFGLDKPSASVTIDYYTVTGVDDNADETNDASATQATAAAKATAVPEESREYATLKLHIGTKFTEGDTEYYYVRPDGSNNVYTMTSDMVSGLIDFNAFSMADPCIYSELIDQMKGYDIEFNGKKHIIERREEAITDDKTEDKNGDGKINNYYVDGKKVDESTLLTLYSAAYLLTLSGEADQNAIQKNADSVLTITYHPNDGKDVIVKYLPYDGTNFYQVDKNGMNYFLTDKRGIDDIISRYENFLSDNGL